MGLAVGVGVGVSVGVGVGVSVTVGVGVLVGVSVTVGVGVGVIGTLISALIYTVCPVTHWVVADCIKTVVPVVPHGTIEIPVPNTNPVPPVNDQDLNAFVLPE